MVGIPSRHKSIFLLTGVVLLQILLLALQIKRDSEGRLIRVWTVGAFSPFERAGSHGLTQRRTQLHPAGRGIVHFGAEEPRRCAARALGFVHRRVGIAEEGFGVGAVRGKQGDPDADARLDVELAQVTNRSRTPHTATITPPGGPT